MNTNYDKTFHYFRAFAILSVLGAHMWISPVIEGLEDKRMTMECLRSVFFHSSTLYFIFISGYLFDHVYKNKVFDLAKFYTSKLRNVALPYVILSILFIGYGSILNHFFEIYPYFINHGKSYDSLNEVLRSLLYGSACITYWYIPFILSVYLVSPLLFHVRDKSFICLVAISSFIPLLVPRAELTDIVSNYGFFYPVFLLGVFFSRYRQACLDFITRHVNALALLAVIFTVVLIDEFYNPVLPNVEMAYYLQRLAIGALVIYVFEHISFESKVLDTLANCSFPLYFLHDFVIYHFQSILFELGLRVSADGLLFVSIFTFLIELAICLVLITFVRYVSGRYSRLLIGG